MSDRRSALVTGSSRGLGRAMALELGKRDYAVAVHYNHSAEAAEAVAEAIREADGRAEVFAADIADPEACKTLVREVGGAFGSLDVLVNNAGINRDGLALRMKPADWQGVLDTDLSSAFYLARAALRGMLAAGWGRIINISSVVALIGNAGQANYVAAKAGLLGLTRALAAEYGAKGITINAVAPGFIESDMTVALSAELKEAYLKRIPAGRFGAPEEVAGVVAFLAGDDAAYVNGHVLTVDGGMTMR